MIQEKSIPHNNRYKIALSARTQVSHTVACHPITITLICAITHSLKRRHAYLPRDVSSLDHPKTVCLRYHHPHFGTNLIYAVSHAQSSYPANFDASASTTHLFVPNVSWRTPLNHLQFNPAFPWLRFMKKGA